MKAVEIRRSFLEYFKRQGHQVLPSSSLVPADDPTLLFTNAGMVQFKKVFLGAEKAPSPRVATAQKCVRAGGKHNDLEQVGVTARHHTFFEMLGNFSFGDYFKRDAISFAWELLTEDLGLEPERISATVHHSDDEAFALWRDLIGLPEHRVFRLGDEDNFWQMADTGPCGPCSELHYDLRASGEGRLSGQSEFAALCDAGDIVEFWNLVFMQFDRNAQGELSPLPAPSIDTGAGLERMAAILQGVRTNYATDLFAPLLDRVADAVGEPYEPEAERGVSFRVLADHARTVAFLLADGVLPSNEGRGYVLRRILRRGVRHAWLLGKREPVLIQVVDEVITQMSSAYPGLQDRKEHILTLTRQEEDRFLDTIEGGMERFDELAPVTARGRPETGRMIPGAEVFKLYDTFGFPVDLTEVMARERGYGVDVEGFERALEGQRARSRADREGALPAAVSAATGDWKVLQPGADQRWVGWESRRADTTALAVAVVGEKTGFVLKENPFYAEAGGQVADRGTLEGDGWTASIDEVRRTGLGTAVFGKVEGELPTAESAGTPSEVAVSARVDEEARHDTERNHTATHLLHAALRKVLGPHVTQRGSLVAPDRLRFDFSHPEPMTPAQIREVEREVNTAIWSDHPVRWTITTRDAAQARGAMALFGEKYGAEVRVVEVPGVSLELCGGNHLRHTGEAGLFVIVRESGVAGGVRRLEALTGPGAFRHLRSYETALDSVAGKLRSSKEIVAERVEALLREREELESLLRDLRQGGSGGETAVHEAEVPVSGGSSVRYRAVRMKVRDAEDARVFGDTFRARESSSVATVAAEAPDGEVSLFVFVTDDLVGRGVRAGTLVKDIAAVTGGRGGGKPHMAQGGVEDASRLDDALRAGEGVLRQLLGV
jgi:alanyl-tRNA synthetase